MTYHINSREFLVGAAVGSMLGTVTALLLAPKSGRRLRQDICDVYCDLSDKTQDMACKVGKKSKTFMRNVGCQTTDLKDRARGVVDDVSDWMHPTEETPRDLLIGSVLGGVLGAVAGLLLAPKSGSELRQDIADTYEDVSEKTQEMADQFTRKGKKVANNVQSQAGEWLDLAKQVISQLAGDAQDTAEEVVEKGRNKLHSSKNRANEIMEWASLGLRAWQGITNRR
jgi:gas vesicle protein